MPWGIVATGPPRPERALPASIPHISFVAFDFIAVQERPEFVLEGNLLMVLALIPNILAEVINPRLSCGERAIASLPVKLRQPSVLRAQPVVGTGLELPDCVAQRDCTPEEEKRMDVLGLGVDFDRLAAQPMEGPTHVGMEVGAEVIRQARLPVFGGEDEVSIYLGERLWHSFAVLAPLQGAFDSPTGSPRASAWRPQPWAGFYRPVGPETPSSR